MASYADLADMPEDDRIRQIGRFTMMLPIGKTTAFVTDADPPDKVERYKRKLLQWFPQLKIIDQFVGPVENTVSVRIGRIDPKVN